MPEPTVNVVPVSDVVPLPESAEDTREVLAPEYRELAPEAAVEVAGPSALETVLTAALDSQEYREACGGLIAEELKQALARCECADTDRLMDLTRRLTDRVMPRQETVPFTLDMVDAVMGEFLTVVVQLGGKSVSSTIRRLTAEEYQKCLDLERVGDLPAERAASKAMPGSVAAEAEARLAADEDADRKRMARRLSDAYALQTALVSPAIPAGRPLEHTADFLDKWPYAFRAGLLKAVIHHAMNEGQVVDFFPGAA